MKKLLTSAILLLALALPVLAANPTVTITRIYDGTTGPYTNRFRGYSFTFTPTSTSALDTAYVLPAASTPFDIGSGQGAHPADSLITIELSSANATADNVRYTVLVLGTSAVSPEYDAGDLKTWSVLVSDATTFSNAAAGTGGRYVLIKVPIRRLAGQINKLRLAIFEQDGSKDTNDAVTGRILIPIR